MEDTQIIEMFLDRDEGAIRELGGKYHSFCHKIAWNVLRSQEDAEECVNDTWFSVWTSIPPNRPVSLPAFCGRITRGLAIDRLRKRCAGKRMDSHLAALEEELEAFSGAAEASAENKYLQKEFMEAIERFLRGLPQTERVIFVRRYWYTDSIAEIAGHFAKSQGSVKNILYRTRRKLERFLEKEGRLHG